MQLKLKTSILSPARLGRILKPAFDKAMADAKPKIAALIIDRVEAQAGKELRRMAPRYKIGLSQPGSIKITPEAVEVTLMDPVAAAIEGGASGFDLKRVMLSKTKKSSKTGIPYVDVPFSHQAGDIPSGMRKAISRKAAAEGTSTTRLPSKSPGRKFTRTLHKQRVFGVPFGTKRQKVAHKRGIHDDLTRHSAGPRSASYQTIRRISAKSSASSWWHPGFKGLKLFKKVLPPIKADILDIVRDSLRAAGIPTK